MPTSIDGGAKSTQGEVAPVCRWANRVLEEFFLQGDQERAQGLPVSPLMDRHTTSLAISQINFIEFVVAPLFHQVIYFSLPPLLSPHWEGSHPTDSLLSYHNTVACMHVYTAVTLKLSNMAATTVHETDTAHWGCHMSMLHNCNSISVGGAAGGQGVSGAEGDGAVPMGEPAAVERALPGRHRGRHLQDAGREGRRQGAAERNSQLIL